MRLREIKKYGDTFVIKLEPTDLKDMDWKIGQKVDPQKNSKG